MSSIFDFLFDCFCSHSWTFTDTCRGAKSWSHPMCMAFPVEIWHGHGQLSCISSHSWNKYLFHSLMSHFCAFCWWFSCLEWSPSIMLKWCLLFLSLERLWCALCRKYKKKKKQHVLDRLYRKASYRCELQPYWLCVHH